LIANAELIEKLSEDFKGNEDKGKNGINCINNNNSISNINSNNNNNINNTQINGN
jgi:hypothetical protein